MTERHRDYVLSAIATGLGVLACLGPSAAGVAQSSEPAGNLAANPSFEQAALNSVVPAPWSGTPQVYSLDAKVARTGKASLKYVNQDPKRYVLCTHSRILPRTTDLVKRNECRTSGINPFMVPKGV